MAGALGLLPNVGYVRVVKLADGDSGSFTLAANETNANTTSSTTEVVTTFLLWEWEVTFISDGGNLPLMAAVWSEGRTLPASGDGFEATSRAARRTCGTCEVFPLDSWPSAAEEAVGLRMEVKGSISRTLLVRPKRPSPSIEYNVESTEWSVAPNRLYERLV